MIWVPSVIVDAFLVSCKFRMPFTHLNPFATQQLFRLFCSSCAPLTLFPVLSLPLFLPLPAPSITKADRPPSGRDALAKRIEALGRHFQNSLYVQVCR